ncbi:hypothetical protein FNV43_RR18968 [Rhamnella rubrinervis]|uniref:ubiquitinyl hydrolase 1 n=1 Tax=Rhamnella rubrinervis TaxID=2594499 RepID=A0A8K0E6Z6_9ROSA|nr:hypothetical protein FNV43_RR18968 [Rhamnella rubrinervis]
MDGGLPEDLSDSNHRPDSDSDQRVYFVPYRWWKDAQDSVLGDSEGKRGILYAASPASSFAGEEDDPVQNSENGEVGVSGRDYALVPGEMWVQALKWHSDSKFVVKNGKSFLAAEDDMADVYPLQLRLSVLTRNKFIGMLHPTLMLAICSDNSIELFKRACKIFSVDSELLRMWDFSGQTNLYLTNDKSKFPRDCQRQSDEILLELQVYGLSDSMKCRDGKKDDVLLQNSAVGEIALAFGDLLRKLWAPGATPVVPRVFKSKLARFAPQFSGFNQHDSQGQYKSTLVCPVCRKVSVTFDPFMYLSLPLPSTTMRTMTLTVLKTDGSSQPYPYTITVPKHGKFQDLIQALSTACSLGDNETLLVAEIYNNHIIRYLEEPTDSLSLIRDDDRLVAYRLMKDFEQFPLVVFMHQRMEEHYIHGKLTSSWKAFGIPLVSRLCDSSSGSDIRNLYLKLLNPFEMPAEDALEDFDSSEGTAIEKVTGTEDILTPDIGGVVKPFDENGANSPADADLQFYLADDKGTIKESKIEMNEPVGVKGVSRRLNVLVCWPERGVQQYDTCLLSSLPEVFKSGTFSRRPQESVSLYKCLEAFLKEEPLGPEDMWYCPGCKQHQQASKKLDLWRLPEILVIHLKRFSYSRFLKNKLETYVEFPVDDLDLSSYIAHRNDQSCNRYMLYAVSNHYGSMGGGHYTAFVHHGGDRWYDFDDSHVNPISQEKIKSSAAYVLFYRRVVEV